MFLKLASSTNLSFPFIVVAYEWQRASWCLAVKEGVSDIKSGFIEKSDSKASLTAVKCFRDSKIYIYFF